MRVPGQRGQRMEEGMRCACQDRGGEGSEGSEGSEGHAVRVPVKWARSGGAFTSSARAPEAAVSLRRSDPAKSIRWNRDVVERVRLPVTSCVSRIRVKTQCDRLLSLFIKVAPTVRLQVPLRITACATKQPFVYF